MYDQARYNVDVAHLAGALLLSGGNKRTLSMDGALKSTGSLCTGRRKSAITRSLDLGMGSFMSLDYSCSAAFLFRHFRRDRGHISSHRRYFSSPAPRRASLFAV